MEINWPLDEGPQSAASEPSNVVDFTARHAARMPTAEPVLTNEERRELREMIAYYRIARPQFEALKQGCPTARVLLDE